MLRNAFKRSVHPDAHAEYERRDNPSWTELEEAPRAHGGLSYSTFLDQDTNELFAYAKIENEERRHAIASTEVCQPWWHPRRELMPTHRDNSPRTVDLCEVFYIENP
jgi:L-rhamnose mutarotase